MMEPLFDMTTHLQKIGSHPQFIHYDWDMIFQTYFTTLFILYTSSKCFTMYSPNAAFEYVRMTFYTYWSFSSWFFIYQLIVNDDISPFDDYFAINMHIMNCVHLYELLFYTPDMGHCIHHILVIIIQSFTYHNSVLIGAGRYLFGASSHMGMVSSIFSSMRVIARIEIWGLKSALDSIYYWSYLLCKGGGIIFAYWVLYEYQVIDTIENMDGWIVLIMYFAIHLLQLYFCSIIIKKMF